MGNKIGSYLDDTKFQQDNYDQYVRPFFKPGMPLQTRELNELVSHLNFADKMIVAEKYKHNPIVSGCEFTYTYAAGFQNTIAVAPGILYWNGYFVKFNGYTLTPAADFVTTGDVLGFIITQESAGVVGAITIDGPVEYPDALLGDSANDYVNAGAEGADRLRLAITLGFQSEYTPAEFTSFVPVQQIIISASPAIGEYNIIEDGYYVYENIKYKFFESNDKTGTTKLISGGKIKTITSDDTANTIYITINKTTAIINGKYVEGVGEYYQKVLVDRVKTDIGTGRIDNVYLKNDGTVFITHGFESVYNDAVQPGILTDNVLYLGYVKHRYYGEAGFDSFVYINQTGTTNEPVIPDAENISLIIKESFKDLSKITDSDNSGILYSDYSVDATNGTAGRSVDRGSLTALHTETPTSLINVDSNGEWIRLLSNATGSIDAEKITTTIPVTGFGKFKQSSGKINIFPLVDYMSGPTIDVKSIDEDSENIVNIKSDYITYTGTNKSNMLFQSTCRELELDLTISDLRYFIGGVEQDLWVKAFFNSTEMVIGGTDKKILNPKGSLATTTIEIPADMPTGVNVITIVAYTDVSCTDEYIYARLSKEFNAGIESLLTANKIQDNNYTRTSTRYNYTEAIGQSFILSKDTMVSGIDFYAFNSGGKVYPIKVQVRKVIGGIPSNNILAECTIPVGDINLSTLVGSVYTLNATTATFTDHVFIPAGDEFVVTFLTEDDGYSFGIATVGDADVIGTDVVGATPQTLGTLYTSTNNLTWNKSADKFLTCKLNYVTEYDNAPSSTITYTINAGTFSRFMFMTDDVVPNGTRIDYAYSVDGGDYTPFNKGTEIDNNTLVVSNVKVKATLYPNSDNTLSPMVSINNNFITSLYHAGIATLPTTAAEYSASTYQKAYGLSTTYQTGINIYNDVVCEVEVFNPANCDILPVFFHTDAGDDIDNLVINDFVLTPELPEALNKGVLYKSTLADGWEKRTYYFNIDYNTLASDLYMPKDTSTTFRGKILFKSPTNGGSSPIIRNLNWKLLRSYNTLTNDGTVKANSVKAYGAVGDGVTDDTDAINAAIAAINNQTTNKDELYWDAGDYKWTTNLVDFWSVNHTGPGKLIYDGDATEYYPGGPDTNDGINRIYAKYEAASFNCGLSADFPIGVDADGSELITILEGLGAIASRGRWLVYFAAGTYKMATGFTSEKLSNFGKSIEFIGASDDIPVWSAGSYEFGDCVITKNGSNVEQLFQCIAPGVSATKPITIGTGPLQQDDLTIAATTSNIIQEGTIIWRYIGGYLEWKPSTAVLENDLRYYEENVYRAVADGTTGVLDGAPVHVSGSVTDGGVDWIYVGKKPHVPTTEPTTIIDGSKNPIVWTNDLRVEIGDCVRYQNGGGPTYVYRSRTKATVGADILANRPIHDTGIVTSGDGIDWEWIDTYDATYDNYGFIFADAPNITFENFRFQNLSGTGIQLSGKNQKSVYGCIFNNCLNGTYFQGNGKAYVYASVLNTCEDGIYAIYHTEIAIASANTNSNFITNCNNGVSINGNSIAYMYYSVVDACRNNGVIVRDTSKLSAFNSHFLRNYVGVYCQGSSTFEDNTTYPCAFYLNSNWTNNEKLRLESFSKNKNDTSTNHYYGTGELLYIRSTNKIYYRNGETGYVNGALTTIWTNNNSDTIASCAMPKNLPPSWLLTPNQSIKMRIVGFVGGNNGTPDADTTRLETNLNILFDGEKLITGDGFIFDPSSTGLFDIEVLITPVDEGVGGVYNINECNTYIKLVADSTVITSKSLYVTHKYPSNSGTGTIAAIAPEIIDVNGNDSAPVISIQSKVNTGDDWMNIFLVEVSLIG